MALDLEKLECVTRLYGGEIQARCPACYQNGADKTGNHLRIHVDDSYGCAAHKDDPEHTKAIFAMAGLKNGQLSTAPKENILRRVPLDVEVFFQEADLERLLPIRDYWYKRGISDATLDIFKGGMGTVGKMNHRYCFPIYNENGQIHGITGRWTLPVDNDLKWKHLSKTSLWVYPLFLNIKYIKEKKWVILVESIGDLLSLWESGIYNVLVTFGSSISQSLMARLISLDLEQIYIATNKDEKHTVGQDAAYKIKNKLSSFFDEGSLVIKLPIKKDFGLMSKEENQKYIKEIEDARKN